MKITKSAIDPATDPKVFWPLIALATAATVIASQALISAAFSLIIKNERSPSPEQ